MNFENYEKKAKFEKLGSLKPYNSKTKTRFGMLIMGLDRAIIPLSDDTNYMPISA